VGHPGRDPHVQGAGPRADPVATALRARVVDEAPGAPAVAARLGETEVALVVRHQALAAAGGAGARAGARLRAGTTAAGAARRAGQPQPDSGTVHRVGERQTDLALHVGPAPGLRGRAGAAPGTAASEETAEQVTEPTASAGATPGGPAEQVLKVDAAARAEPARTAETAAEAPATRAGGEQRAGLVVLLTGLGVGQDA